MYITIIVSVYTGYLFHYNNVYYYIYIHVLVCILLITCIVGIISYSDSYYLIAVATIL